MDQMGTLNKCMNQHDHDQYNDDKYDSLDDQDHHDQRMTNLMTTNTALTIVMIRVLMF